MTTDETLQYANDDFRSTDRSRKIDDLIAVGLFCLISFVYFTPLILAKAALFYFDITEINYAYRHYFAENLKAGRIDFWCHQLYNGLPLFAESQAGYFHPLKFVLYPWMSTWAALGYDMVASLALTGLGTYVWLRRHAHPAGALAGALISVFGGFTWAHFVHTSMVNALAAVPWIIWGIERSWRTGRFGGSAVAAFALATQVLAGHLQDALMSIQLVGVMTFFAVIVKRDAASRKRAIVHALAAVGFGVAIAAVQWIPSYDLLKRTPRTEGLTWQEQTFGSWHPQLLPTLFVREAYGTRARDTDWMDGFYPYHEMNAYLGATALLFALIGARRWRDPWVGLWVFVAFVAAVFMLGRFTFVMDFWHRVPILGSSRIPVRYHLWATFSVAALASQGTDMVVRGREKLSLKQPLAILGILMVLAGAIFAWGMIPWWTEANRWTAEYHQERNRWLTAELVRSGIRSVVLFAVGLVVLRVAMRSKSMTWRTIGAFFMAVLIGVDLVSVHWSEMPTVDPSFWTASPPAVGVVSSDPKASRIMGVARFSAGEPGYASKPTDFFPPRDALGWSLPLAYGLESNIGETPFRPARLIRLTDLSGRESWRFSIEGVTHIVSAQQLNPSMKPVQAGTAFVYRLPDPEPRFHWAREVRFVTDDAAAEAAMRSLGARNAGEVVVVESSESSIPQGDGPGEDLTSGIRVISYGGDRIILDLEALDASWLRIGVSFDRGWRAWIDGAEIAVHPAQLAYMAVRVPAGRHQVELHYLPVHFRLGGCITLGAILLLAVIVVSGRTIGRMTPQRTQPEIEMQSTTDSTPSALSPSVLTLIAVALLAFSTVAIGAGGSPELSSRWADSWHRFTWGAGIEAMNRK